MKLHTRSFIISFSLISATFLFASTHAIAQEHGFGHPVMNAYGNGYDDGYEDGYDDAMEDCPCPPKSQLGGWYIGAGLGYDSYRTQGYGEFAPSTDGNLRMSSNGLYGNVLGGYGKYFNSNTPVFDYYLGAEAFVGKTHATGGTTLSWGGTMYTGTVSPGMSYGLDFTPGVKVGSGPLLFLNFGLERTQFTINETVNNTGGSSAYSDTWTNGGKIGLGLQSSLSKQFDIRMEYNHVDYSTIKTYGTAGNTINNSPSDNQTELDLIFRPRF